MDLSEAMKLALHHRQIPMTAPQIAYFLSVNKTINPSSLDVLAKQVQAEALLNPAHFDVCGNFIQLSSWNESEREIIQHVFNVIQTAYSLYSKNALGFSHGNNLILSLILFKRLSDITRSQQHSTPIVPYQFKFNQILSGISPADLPNKLYSVFEYIESTDNRLAGIFEASRYELSSMRPSNLIDGLHSAMNELSALNLNEDLVPTPLFQVVFSRILLISIAFSRIHLTSNSWQQ